MSAWLTQVRNVSTPQPITPSTRPGRGGVNGGSTRGQWGVEVASQGVEVRVVPADEMRLRRGRRARRANATTHHLRGTRDNGSGPVGEAIGQDGLSLITNQLFVREEFTLVSEPTYLEVGGSFIVQEALVPVVEEIEADTTAVLRPSPLSETLALGQRPPLRVDYEVPDQSAISGQQSDRGDLRALLH